MESDITDLLNSVTCPEFIELITSFKDSFYESRNHTRESYVASILSHNCTATPHLGIKGLKKWIMSIILGSFLIFGLIGNLLSATIMFRRARRGLSSYFYLALLAIVDITILFTGCLLGFVEVLFNYYPQSENDSYCRIVFYIQHLFTYVSAWLIVAVTFERFIVVRFPFQSIRICRLRVAYAITSLILIIFSLYTTHGFFTMGIREIEIRTEEDYHPKHKVCDLRIHRRLLAFLDLCFYSVVPSCLILIFNILIIYTMFYAIKQRQNYLQASSGGLRTTNTYPHPTHRKNKSSSSVRSPFFRSRSIESTPGGGRSFISHVRAHQVKIARTSSQCKSQQILFDSSSATGIRLTCLLLIISFIFVLCTLPISIRSLMADYTPELKSTNRWAITQLSLTTLMYLNHTINFVLYCLTGRAFRHECRKLLCGLWTLKNVRITCAINPPAYKQQIRLSEHHQLRLMKKSRV